MLCGFCSFREKSDKTLIIPDYFIICHCCVLILFIPSGLLSAPTQSSDPAMVEVELEPASSTPAISPHITTITEEDESKDEAKESREEKTTIQKL